MNAALQQYLDLFGAQRERLQTASPEAMNAVRQSAFDLLQTDGLPTRRTERYKYTDVSALLAPDYGLNLLRHAPKAMPARCAVPGLFTQTIYVAGDVPMLQDNKAMERQKDVEVLSLAEAQSRCPSILHDYYHAQAAQGNDPLAALNTLLAQDGLLIYIKEGAHPITPLQIVFTASTRTAAMHNRRLLVVCEARSRAQILLCDHCESSAPTLTTQVTEVFLGKGAELEVYGVEETRAVCNRVHNLYARQEADSRLSVCDVTLRAGLSRTMADVTLEGARASVHLAGAVVAGGTQHIDNNLLVTHQAPECNSEMLYKSVLDGESTVAFAGKVYVAPGAQQTVSHQTSANLCLSPTSRALTQPMLEIYADDVKCNHGATVGKLDEAALFYMRQRGIGEEEARLLLQHAFVSEIVAHIGLPALRDRLTTLIDQRIRGAADTHCAGCGLCGK